MSFFHDITWLPQINKAVPPPAEKRRQAGSVRRQVGSKEMRPDKRRLLPGKKRFLSSKSFCGPSNNLLLPGNCRRRPSTRSLLPNRNLARLGSRRFLFGSNGPHLSSKGMRLRMKRLIPFGNHEREDTKG